MSTHNAFEKKTAFMALINALGTEQRSYESLLRLLEEQQDGVMNRDGAAVLAAADKIEKVMDPIKQERQRREDLQRELALRLGFTNEPELKQLVLAVGEHGGKEIARRVEEINSLLLRARHRAAENQALMGRSIKFMESVGNHLARFRCAIPPAIARQAGT